MYDAEVELLNYHGQKMMLDHHAEIWEQSVLEDWDRWQTLVNEVMNIRVPLNAGNCLISRERVSISRRTLLHGVSK